MPAVGRERSQTDLQRIVLRVLSAYAVIGGDPPPPRRRLERSQAAIEIVYRYRW